MQEDFETHKFCRFIPISAHGQHFQTTSYHHQALFIILCSILFPQMFFFQTTTQILSTSRDFAQAHAKSKEGKNPIKSITKLFCMIPNLYTPLVDKWQTYRVGFHNLVGKPLHSWPLSCALFKYIILLLLCLMLYHIYLLWLFYVIGGKLRKQIFTILTSWEGHALHKLKLVRV